MKTKVNIDQFVMDTRWREWLWNIKRKHKVGFLINRIQWYLYPNIQYISKFPLHIDFEVSSLCNMRCPMCFRPHRTDQNDGLMDVELFKNAIDECAKFGLYSIRVSWRGESTTHPELIEMIRYAKKKSIKEVSFLTNALEIKNEYAKELVLSGVDYISISIDGMYEEYNKIRKPAKFEETIERIKNLRRLRDTIGKGYPLLKVNTIWTQVKDCAKDYYTIFSPIVDIISFNPDYDYSETKVDIPSDFICQYPYQRLSVKWNGEIPMCISDWDGEIIIGDLRKDTLYEIWNGERMNEIRKMHINGKIHDISPCKKCHRPVTVQIGSMRNIDGET